jgi:hypothetical protein
MGMMTKLQCECGNVNEPILKNDLNGTGGVAQVIENLPSKFKPSSSNPGTTKNKQIDNKFSCSFNVLYVT